MKPDWSDIQLNTPSCEPKLACKLFFLKKTFEWKKQFMWLDLQGFVKRSLINQWPNIFSYKLFFIYFFSKNTYRNFLSKIIYINFFINYLLKYICFWTATNLTDFNKNYQILKLEFHKLFPLFFPFWLMTLNCNYFFSFKIFSSNSYFFLLLFSSLREFQTMISFRSIILTACLVSGTK